jgi:hypothetical protein
MYFPWNWEFGSVLSKLRNFGGGGVETPHPPPHRTPQPPVARSLNRLHEISIRILRSWVRASFYTYIRAHEMSNKLQHNHGDVTNRPIMDNF